MTPTKEDADNALAHLRAWECHPNHFGRDRVAQFITSVREQLPAEAELVAEINWTPKVLQEKEAVAPCKHATDSVDYLAYPCGDPSCERHKEEYEANV